MRLNVESGPPLAGGIIGAGGELSWPAPTRPGDVLHVESEIVEITPSRSRANRGTIVLLSQTMNKRGEVVQILKARLVVQRRVANRPRSSRMFEFVRPIADILAAYVLNLGIYVLWLRPRGNRACETESRTHQRTLIDILAHSVHCGTLDSVNLGSNPDPPARHAGFFGSVYWRFDAESFMRTGTRGSPSWRG